MLKTSILLIISCLFSFTISFTVGIDETIQAQQRGDESTVDITSFNVGDIVQVELQIKTTQVYTTLSLYASLEHEKSHSDIDISDFFHKKPIELENYDLDAMLDTRRKQYINLRKNSAHQNELYLSIFKFDPTRRKHDVLYRVTVTNGNAYQCQPCANGGTPNSNCFCEDCQGGSSGKICSRSIYGIQNNLTTFLIEYRKYHFYIAGLENSIIQSRVSIGEGEIYIQYEQFEGEVADYYNFHVGNGYTYAFRLNQAGNKFPIYPSGKKTLITAYMFSFDAEFTLVYYDESGVSVLVIVMAVLGGIILVGLIIAAICIIRKSRQNNARVRSELEIPANSNQLSADEIDRYFPSVVFGDVVAGESNQTMNNLQKDKQNSVDCVICLETLVNTDAVRIGFCGHIFHGSCLVGWFNKQRNCPFCRKDYSRENTEKQFTNLTQKNGNKNLKSLQLAQIVYHNKNSHLQVQTLE